MVAENDIRADLTPIFTCLKMDKDSSSEIQVAGTNKQEEVNMPEVVAGLKMLAVDLPDGESPPQQNQRRSSRKRKPVDHLDMSALNRRCNTRPRKRTFSEMESEEQIKEYYLDKTVKKHTNSLETIFEEKEDSNQTTNCMSAKRFKRMIQFNSQPTESKLKKRRDKIKKIFGSKIGFKKKKVSMQSLLDKLNSLQSDVPLNAQKERKVCK
ncbi:protein tantalus [Trichogramma pretiosum]|uniref:protein tantalus n=1 Tax=Trichogramma pretiosum TaxID=7493 RepID=UPI0006C96936|nr:protein tantalus [Trichogramma pretiosum]